MEEKENKSPENWHEVIERFAEMQKDSSDKLTSEILKDKDKEGKRWRTVAIVLSALLFLSNFIWLVQWTSYDYVSQDGEGYNYYNSDVDGSVTNGTADQEEEE